MNQPARFVLGFALLCVLACHVPAMAETPVNRLTEAEKRSGWKLLFDGTTAGWRNYREEGLSDGWVAADGELRREKKGAGDIITINQYEYFELVIDYRISKGGNSGIFFHVTEDDPRAALSGPEVQIQDNVAGHDREKSGWLYQLYKPVTPDWVRLAEKHVNSSTREPEIVDATRPAGQWNQVYLRISPEQCEVVMNGIHYFHFKKGDEEWDRRVAASKFAKFPAFGKANKGHICLQDHSSPIAFRNIKIRELGADGSAPDPIDGRLPLKGVLAFPNLKWDGWEPIDERGRPQELRVLELTDAGDGTNRLFAATQDGMVQVFDNDPAVKRSKLFLDLRGRVADFKIANEEGLLGFAFHPRYKKTGEFFVYYTSKSKPPVSIVSRFRVSTDDPNRADPDSEEVLMRIPQPFYNHNGGSIKFGPDGYLYIGLGDGGSRNDPLGNGQNLATWMGSILRIDVDKKQAGRNYAIPSSNPFVDRKKARPEIYAYGFRNPWRLAFDKKTGALWVGDVGQDLWEEVNIVRRGGNYGWSIREGSHPFGNRSQSPVERPIAPVWEYDHQIGKSITGGMVYRGSRFPELNGSYLYADFVTGKIWALDYDRAAGKIVKNMGISPGGIVVLAFGQDEAGEAYYTIASPAGRCIYRFEHSK